MQTKHFLNVCFCRHRRNRKIHFSFDSVRFAIFILFFHLPNSLHFDMVLFRCRLHIYDCEGDARQCFFLPYFFFILVFSQPEIYLVKWHCLHYIRCVNVLNCINYSSMMCLFNVWPTTRNSYRDAHLFRNSENDSSKWKMFS